VILTCHEAGAAKELEDQLAFQATHDVLTGLCNRRELVARLHELAADRHGRCLALLYLDLDRFKEVNDAFGHEAGDRVLGTVAERLRKTVPAGGLVCRFGGDEFGVLLTGADEASAAAAADRLLAAVREPVAVGTTVVHVGASVGVAVAGPARTLRNPEQLIRESDRAMYAAKQAGGHRCAYVAGVAPDRAGVGTMGEDGADGRGPAAGGERARPDAPPPPPPAPPPPPGDTDPPIPTAAPRRLAARLLGLVPALAVASIVIGIAVLGQRQSAGQRRQIEAQRLEDMRRLTARGADYYSAQFDPKYLLVLVNAIPWSLNGSPGDEVIIRRFAESPLVGRNAVASLHGLDGRVLARHPREAPVTVTANSPIFRTAVAGRSGFDPTTPDPDRLRSYFALPVRRNGQVMGVMTLGVSLDDGTAQRFMELQGSLGLDAGGWSLTDSHGVTFASWDRRRLGHRLVEPWELTGLEPGESRVVATGGTDVVVAALLMSMSTPRPVYYVFTQPRDRFNGDLRAGAPARDAALAAVVLAALAALAGMNHRREQTVRRSEAQLDALLQHAHDIVVVLDSERAATFVSSAVTPLLGGTPASYLGKRWTFRVHHEDRGTFERLLDQARGGDSRAATDVRLRDGQGRYRWFDLDAVDLRGPGAVTGLLLTCHEVGERRQLQEQLAYQAIHDPLTGLPNRALFSARLDELAAARNPVPFAVLFVDLDRFKPVNDTHGHGTGDQVLQVIAERLRRSVRTELGHDGGIWSGDIVCRLGGDEFAILLMDVTEQLARVTAERILEAVAEPVSIGDVRVELGATIGIALSRADREHPDHAVRNADQAMYRAKAAGRGRYEVFRRPRPVSARR
jgi:diguanylate cyclase (GGDEF)-like protein/PAS domain S-box-containing protein